MDGHLLAIRFRQSTDSTMFRQETVFQINCCLTNKVVRADQIVIEDRNCKVFVHRDLGGEFKHST